MLALYVSTGSSWWRNRCSTTRSADLSLRLPGIPNSKYQYRIQLQIPNTKYQYNTNTKYQIPNINYQINSHNKKKIINSQLSTWPAPVLGWVGDACQTCVAFHSFEIKTSAIWKQLFWQLFPSIQYLFRNSLASQVTSQRLIFLPSAHPFLPHLMQFVLDVFIHNSLENIWRCLF